MSLTLARSGSDWIMQDGAFVENCECCGTHSSACASYRLPASLKLIVTFSLDGGSSSPEYSVAVTMDWDSNVCGFGASEGWCYTGGDVCLASGLYLRSLSLFCSGSSWVVELVVNNNGFQDEVFSATPTTVSSNPIYLTHSSGSGYSTAVGSGTFKIHIEEEDAVPPECGFTENSCAGKPSSLTVNYLINGTISGSLTAFSNSSTSIAYDSGAITICDNGGGDVIIARVAISYASGGWQIEFDLERDQAVFGFLSGLNWIENFTTGQVYTGVDIDCVDGTCAFNNTSRSGLSAAYSCGGDSYPFNGAVGTVPLSLTWS